MSEVRDFGGIEFKHIIAFQTKIMMGAQYKRVIGATDKKDIIIACLRVGWNDAFRHTSVNVKKGEETILKIESEKWDKEHKAEHDDYICGNILNQAVLLDSFYDFAKASDVCKKIIAVENRFSGLQDLFKDIKEIDGEKQLCFGHFQKMFNIALKLYLCLYMCRHYLELSEDLFDDEILDNLKNADCPIDSIILSRLGRDYSDFRWSKFGTEGYPVDTYQTVQRTISELADGNSNLYFDFKEWNK